MDTVAEHHTRLAIISAARDILVHEGHEALSMRKVAGQVGISAPGIYRHFASKDELLSAAVNAGARAFGAYLVDALSETKPLARLRRMGERYFDFVAEHPHDYQLLFMIDSQKEGMPQLDQRTREETVSTFQLLVDRIVECQKSGDVRRGEPAKLAVLVWATYHGLASLRIVGRLNASDEEYRLLVRAQIDAAVLAVAATKK